MAAPNISESVRYIGKGTTRFVWADTIADISAPTRPEIDAGTDLSNQIQEIDGWVVEAEAVETPDLGRLFTGSIPGPTSADDSSLTMYLDQGGTDIRDIVAMGDNGNMIVMHGGDVAGRTMDVFPARVASLGKNLTVDADPATVTVSFNITSEPSADVVIPA